MALSDCLQDNDKCMSSGLIQPALAAINTFALKSRPIPVPIHHTHSHRAVVTVEAAMDSVCSHEGSTVAGVPVRCASEN
jgi:hypothetical protein